MGEHLDSETSPDNRPTSLPAEESPEAHLAAYDSGGIATRNPDGTTHIVYDPATAAARARLVSPLADSTKPVAEV